MSHRKTHYIATFKQIWITVCGKETCFTNIGQYFALKRRGQTLKQRSTAGFRCAISRDP